MPRKQRFKPSRKPKPIPQNEEPMTVRQPSSAQEHGDQSGSSMSSDMGRDPSAVEPHTDDRSR
jgi:hypothetical protein